jgi:hypothetical protein
MPGVPERYGLLFKADRAVGRHLFILGLVLLLVIAIGLATAGTVAVLLLRHGQPWWIATGASSIILAGMAAALRPVPRILGPEGVTGIIKQRNNSPVAGLLETNAERGQPPSSAS